MGTSAWLDTVLAESAYISGLPDDYPIELVAFLCSHLGSVGLFGCSQYAAVDGKESAEPDAGNTVFLRPMVPIALIEEAGSIERSGGSARIESRAHILFPAFREDSGIPSRLAFHVGTQRGLSRPYRRGFRHRPLAD